MKFGIPEPVGGVGSEVGIIFREEFSAAGIVVLNADIDRQPLHKVEGGRHFEIEHVGRIVRHPYGSAAIALRGVGSLANPGFRNQVSGIRRGKIRGDNDQINRGPGARIRAADRALAVDGARGRIPGKLRGQRHCANHQPGGNNIGLRRCPGKTGYMGHRYIGNHACRDRGHVV